MRRDEEENTHLSDDDVEMVLALRLSLLDRSFRSRYRFRDVQTMEVDLVICTVRVVLYRYNSRMVRKYEVVRNS